MFIRSILLASTVLALSAPVAALACDMCKEHEKKAEAAAHKPAHKEEHKKEHKGHEAVWGYGGKAGPAFWGELDAANNACTQGKAQSPINITQYMKGDLPDLGFAYNDVPLTVKNTGHTAQVVVPPGSKVTIDGHAYELKQIRFHTPSEHYSDGAPYPMEAHLYHEDEKGKMAVISVMMKLGGANATIDKIWSHIPAEAGQEDMAGDDVMVSVYDLLPAAPEYFTYEGSFTTPPCTEGVKWVVMQQPIEISQAQLGAFQSQYPMNARPLQDMNGRIVKGD